MVEVTIEISRRTDNLGNFTGYEITGKAMGSGVKMVINTGDSVLDADLLRLAMPNVKFGG